uniref:Uncharacterized protein n=1 Tax=Arundo donax TaxID=35708 RepID=A0A0A9GMB2_ARUDO
MADAFRVQLLQPRTTVTGRQSYVAVRADDFKYYIQCGEVEWIIPEPSPLSDADNHHKDDIASELRKCQVPHQRSSFGYHFLILGFIISVWWCKRCCWWQIHEDDEQY